MSAYVSWIFGGDSSSAASTSSATSSSTSSSSSSSSSSISVISDSKRFSSDVDKLEDEGLQLLSYASSCESTGALDDAFEAYKVGLQRLMDASKKATTEVKRENLRNFVAKYISLAEQLQRRIQARNSLLSSSSSSSSSSSDLAFDILPKQNHSESKKKNISTKKANAKKKTTTSEKSLEKKKTVSSFSESKSSSSSSSSSIAIDPALRSAIESEIIPAGATGVKFSDVVGMDYVKQALKEMILLPALRPDLFTGIRRPPRGLLLYGPPGTGKSFLVKALSSESGCCFFNISASSLVSKNFGESEKLIRALFQIAKENSPSIIFLDEIDALLSRRSESDHEAARRMKTEFFIQMDGLNTSMEKDNIFIIAATNLPQSLDEAFSRRLPRKLYLPLPDFNARLALFKHLLKDEKHSLSNGDFQKIVEKCDGYSNSDLKAVVAEAAMTSIRQIKPEMLIKMSAEQVPPMKLQDFMTALEKFKPSVSKERLQEYVSYARQQGVAN